jgi:hypothetical protein
MDQNILFKKFRNDGIHVCKYIKFVRVERKLFDFCSTRNDVVHESKATGNESVNADSGPFIPAALRLYLRIVTIFLPTSRLS